MAFLGGFVTLIFVYFRLNRFNVLFTDYIKLFIMSIISAFIGGYVLFFITQIPRLIANFSLEAFLHIISHSGIVFYGGLFGVLIALKLFSRFSVYNQQDIFRLVAPALPLFHAFGRLGCFLSGCCYGKDLGATIYFFDGVYIDKIPVQLFETIFNLLLFAVLLFIEKKHKNVDILRIYLISYATFRFINEFFRGDTIRGIFFGLSTAQWISIIIILYYIIKFIIFVNAKAKVKTT